MCILMMQHIPFMSRPIAFPQIYSNYIYASIHVVSHIDHTCKHTHTLIYNPVHTGWFPIHLSTWFTFCFTQSACHWANDPWRCKPTLPIISRSIINFLYRLRIGLSVHHVSSFSISFSPPLFSRRNWKRPISRNQWRALILLLLVCVYIYIFG